MSVSATKKDTPKKGDDLALLEDKTFFGTPSKSLESRIHKREEKELRRVFNYLSGFKERHKYEVRIEQQKQVIKQKRALLKASQDRDAVSRYQNGGRSSVMAPTAGPTNEAIEEEIRELMKEVTDYEQLIKKLKDNPHKKITKGDLYEAMKIILGTTCTKKQIDDMIWEADESLDSSLDWNEVKYYLVRTIEDETGLEPRSLYFVIQFLMFDTNMDGVISVDDTMEILFHRYSREALDRYMKSLFGDALDLPFKDYMARVTKHHQEGMKRNSS